MFRYGFSTNAFRRFDIVDALRAIARCGYAGVEILGDKQLSVLSVAAPVTEEQEAAAAEGEPTAPGEVEMIKEKKEEGAEGEAAPAKGEKGAAKGAADKGAAAKGAADKGAAAKGAPAAGKTPEKSAEAKPEKKK